MGFFGAIALGIKVSTEDGEHTGLATDPIPCSNNIELCYAERWSLVPVWISTADPKAAEILKSDPVPLIEVGFPKHYWLSKTKFASSIMTAWCKCACCDK